MVASWHVKPEGDTIAKGQEIADIETIEDRQRLRESRPTGMLRRRLVEAGETLPVGALLGVVADETVPDAEIDAFVAGLPGEVQGAARRRRPRPRAPSPRPSTSAAGGIRYLAAGRGRGRRPSSSSTASAATSTAGCSTSRPLAEQRHQLRPRPAGPRRLEQGRGRGHHRRRWPAPCWASWTPSGIERRAPGRPLAGRGGGARAGALAPRPGRLGDAGLPGRARAGHQHGLHRRLHRGQPAQEAGAGAPDAGRTTPGW